jgi:hypothetical protein
MFKTIKVINGAEMRIPPGSIAAYHPSAAEPDKITVLFLLPELSAILGTGTLVAEIAATEVDEWFKNGP